MSNYLRRRIEGGTYFFTVRLQDLRADLLTARIDLLRSVTRLCMKRWPFQIAGAVILPSKLHMIWILPEGDADYSKRWRMIKSTFSRHVPPPDDRPESHRKRVEKGIWQRRFWEHAIRDQNDFALHMHLIAAAPVHAGLVKRPADWPFSSLQRRKVGLDPPIVRTTAQVPSDPDLTIAANAN
ncbi:REP-associated tyrosine transposase [Loktanella agnita]|uniref:REP-associated tyrosine transposase n=1 Tax=Loktanella agnita TaxID=287097 RepID=UPI003987883B